MEEIESSINRYLWIMPTKLRQELQIAQPVVCPQEKIDKLKAQMRVQAEEISSTNRRM
jgi:hypothetical protein